MRDCVTDFVRSLRASLLEAAEKRGRPLVLVAKVPETIAGCHFDGLHVERWVEEDLVDGFVLGCRSLEVDIAAFRHLTRDSGIKLYPSHDQHHSSDGYNQTSPEVLRGVASNWWRQQADGIELFNFTSAPPLEGNLSAQDWDLNRMSLRELGDPATLRGRDKRFVVQRRAGGHPWIFGFPEERRSQSWTYHNSNMEAQLPAILGSHAQGMTILHLYVGDDVNDDVDHVAALRLHLLVSDRAARGSSDDRIGSAEARAATYADDDHQLTSPIARSLVPLMEVRVNNSSLGQANIIGGWLQYEVAPNQLAAGDTLIVVKVTGAPAGVAEEIVIERLELEVVYRQES